MIDMHTIAEDELNIGMQLLRSEFAKRGWQAKLAYKGSAVCYVDRGDGKPLLIFSTTPPTTSYAAAYIANDKYACYELLSSIGARQLKSVVVSERYTDEGARALLRECGRVVVKPIDGGHGKGITVGVSTEAALEDAIAYGLTFAKSSQRVIVQRHYPHEKMYDLRLACIDGKFIAATWRMAARVFGDGVHTVQELIERENQSSNRGVPYYAPLAMIDVQRAASFLGDDYFSVPGDGVEVQVLGVANYGAGGEIIDVTDDIPDWMIGEAEKVSTAAGLYVSGVDYMVAIPPRADASEEELDPVIIELNKCPSLAIHDAPTRGQPRGAVAAYVDYLARIPTVTE